VNQKNRFIKAVILWSVVAILFTVTAASLLAYAYGYRYDLTNRTIFKSGLLAVTTEPKNTLLVFEDKNKSIPTTIRGLASGSYHFTIEKSGYRPWLGQAVIVPGLATEMKDIQLVASTNTQTKIFDEPLVNFWPDTNRAVVELSRWDKNKVQLLDFETGLARPLFADLPIVYTVKNALFSPDDNFVLISAYYQGGLKRFIVDLTQETHQILPSAYTSLPFEDFVWHPYTKGRLFVKRPDKTVEIIDLGEELLIRPYLETTPSFTVNRNNALFLRQAENGLELVEKNLYDESEKILTTAIPQANYYRLLTADGHLLLLTAVDNRFLDFVVYPWHQNGKAAFAELGHAQEVVVQDKQIVWRSGRAIHRYDLVKEIDRLLYENASTTPRLLKVSPTVIYVSEGNKLKMFDIWGLNPYELSQSKIDTNIYVDKNQESLFFLLGNYLTQFSLKESGGMGFLGNIVPWN